jgi:hypothetical protein
MGSKVERLKEKRHTARTEGDDEETVGGKDTLREQQSMREVCEAK